MTGLRESEDAAGAAQALRAADALPDLAAEVLAHGEEVRQLAERYRFAERMVVTSRGYGYPTAKEAALKLMETSYAPRSPRPTEPHTPASGVTPRAVDAKPA